MKQHSLVQRYRFIGAEVFQLFRSKYKTCTCSCTVLQYASKKIKFFTLDLVKYEMRNSCTTVFPNARAWEQQERFFFHLVSWHFTLRMFFHCHCRAIRASFIQYGSRKWGIHARVFSRPHAHGNSKIEI